MQRAASGRGLRDAHVRGNDIWTVGEWGHVAHSSDRGLTWEVHGWRYRGCLFGVVENTDGSLWIAGDKGQVARSTDGKKWRKCVGMMLIWITRSGPCPANKRSQTDYTKCLYLRWRLKS